MRVHHSNPSNQTADQLIELIKMLDEEVPTAYVKRVVTRLSSASKDDEDLLPTGQCVASAFAEALNGHLT